jgi:hypothetical protein
VHNLQQWPLIQPDPRKAGVIDGALRFVSSEVKLLQRPALKETSDEHGEAMHRMVKAQHHNMGGGRAPMVHPGTCERECQSTRCSCAWLTC